MNVFPRGSEWRKWDLHVHTPFTKCNNNYRTSDKTNVWDKFNQTIEESDVAVFGITDYFSVDNFFTFIEKFNSRYPESKKIFFPNIELKLNESVNSVQEEVNIHIVFRPDITRAEADKFLHELKTEITDSNDRRIPCSELTADQFSAATVTRDNIKTAIKNTFGEKNQQDRIIIITAANNDGIRPPRGSQRKENITDQIDKFSDAYFGGSQNKEYFLKTDRLEDEQQVISPKPVFSGSDPHDFNQLENWLGKQVRSEGISKEITWVKSDPTFEGLQQTIIEPKDRVAIQVLKPDEKELHKLIDKVIFSGSRDFPNEAIELNSNLCSIIGSRSSGKSALLAYIAHSVSQDDTIARQLDVQGTKLDEIGPAAGKSWKDVEDITCQVVWGSGLSDNGKVVYIPQNYLYSISNRPTEITNKIEPVLFKQFSPVRSQYEKTTSELKGHNTNIESAVDLWFDIKESCDQIWEDLRGLGDKVSLSTIRDGYQSQIDELKTKLSITEEDINEYQAVTQLVTSKKTRQTEINSEQSSFSPFLKEVEGGTKVEISATISYQPAIDSLPTTLSQNILLITNSRKADLLDEVMQEIANYRKALSEEYKTLGAEIILIEKQNKNLFERNQQNEELTKLVGNVNKQNSVLVAIGEKEKQINDKKIQLTEQIEIIKHNIASRSVSLNNLDSEFQRTDQTKEKIVFGVEISFDREVAVNLADKFNRNNRSPYLNNELIDIAKVRSEVESFLGLIYTGEQKLKNGLNKRDVAKDILASTEEIRFNAVLEGDKIGGFSRSSMTPGKRALFALTLMLSEIDDAWPLLIDQPEDDLDSRSIYEQIVPYLVERKKERQIIMVSHNANLVIGADSEQILVANKHGDDRKNKDSRTFDYFSGSLECSMPKCENLHILDTCGIREHSCEILDGGEEAFEKRRNKYNI